MAEGGFGSSKAMQSEASIITTTLTQVVALAGGLGCLGWLLIGFPG